MSSKNEEEAKQPQIEGALSSAAGAAVCKVCGQTLVCPDCEEYARLIAFYERRDELRLAYEREIEELRPNSQVITVLKRTGEVGSAVTSSGPDTCDR